MVEGTLDLFKGFQKQNQIKASKLLYLAAKEEALHQKYLLAFRVMQCFYDIEFFQGALDIAIEQQKISEENLKFVSRQEELGLKAGADLNEAKSLFLNDELVVVQAQNNVIAAKLKLIQEMNLKNVNDITIRIGLQEDSNFSKEDPIVSDTIFDKAKKFIPIIKSGELQLEGAKKQLSIERGKLYPSLEAFGQYGTGYYQTIVDASGNTVSFNKQFQDNTYQVIGLALNIPILDGWSTRTKIKQQKIEVARAANDLEIQKQELLQTIQELVQQYKAIEKELMQSKKNLEAQKVAFEIAQKRYEKGLINTIELFTAKNQLARAKNENLRVRLTREVNQSTLDFYSGLPVFKINRE